MMDGVERRTCKGLERWRGGERLAIRIVDDVRRRMVRMETRKTKWAGAANAIPAHRAIDHACDADPIVSVMQASMISSTDQ
jgi:hypothetical protein